VRLHIQTDVTEADPASVQEPESPPTPTPTPFIGKMITPGHLRMNHFGSRFLPHSTLPIQCLLPLMRDRLLLIGHNNGLSVLDMYPEERVETGGISHHGPAEAKAWPIWRGERSVRPKKVSSRGDLTT
jgi:hypothetical protein